MSFFCLWRVRNGFKKFSFFLVFHIFLNFSHCLKKFVIILQRTLIHRFFKTVETVRFSP